MDIPPPLLTLDGRTPGNVRRARRRLLLLGAVMIASGFIGFSITWLIMRRPEMKIPPLPLAYPFTPSPNCDDRPPGIGVTCIVLHSTVVPTLEGTVRVFQDPKNKVSAHFVVAKDGRVVQMVPVERRAWHAGVSELEGEPRVNDFSVGIEMVNRNDGADPYPEAQMQAVAGIIRLVRSRYLVPDLRIVSHAQIALPPGRKSDPLNFDFARIRAMAR